MFYVERHIYDQKFSGHGELMGLCYCFASDGDGILQFKVNSEPLGPKSQSRNSNIEHNAIIIKIYCFIVNINHKRKEKIHSGLLGRHFISDD